MDLRFRVQFEGGHTYTGKVRDYDEDTEQFDLYFVHDRTVVKFSQGELLEFAVEDIHHYDAGTAQPSAGVHRVRHLETVQGKLYHRATSLVTVGVNHFLADLHFEAKNISKIFQTNNLDVWTVRQRVTDGIATIGALKHRATYGEYTQLFFAQLDTTTCCFRGKEVWFEENDISDAVRRLEALFVEFVNDTEVDLRRRFDSLLSHPVLQATRAFEHSRWPSSEQTGLVDTFGNDDIDYLLTHYAPLLVELDVDAKLAATQWTSLKREVIHDPVKAGMTREALWNRLYDHFSDRSDPGHYYHILMLHLVVSMIALDTSCCERTFSLMNRLSRFQRSKLGLAMPSTLVTIIELGRATGWTDIAKIPVDAIIERWMAKGCEKGQSRRLQKLFADGHVVDAEMEQAAGVTVSDVRVAT